MYNENCWEYKSTRCCGAKNYISAPVSSGWNCYYLLTKYRTVTKYWLTCGQRLLFVFNGRLEIIEHTSLDYLYIRQTKVKLKTNYLHSSFGKVTLYMSFYRSFNLECWLIHIFVVDSYFRFYFIIVIHYCKCC